MAQHITSDAVLEDIRAGHPHTLDRYLSYVPRNVVFSCQILGTALQDVKTKGYYGFSYDNETGDYTDIRVGMTVEFGITEDGNELGVGRIRKDPTDSIMYINESDAGKLGLADNVWVSVIDHYGPHLKKPRLVGSKDGTEFTNSFQEFHDYDIAYAANILNVPKSNIFGLIGELLRLADWCDPGEVYRTMYLRSGAQSISASIDTITWDVGDCTITDGDVNSTEITVQIPVGFRWIHLTVVDEDGGTDIMHLPLWTHDDTFLPMAYYTSGAGFKVTSDQRSAGREMGFEFFGQDNALDMLEFPKTTTVYYWEKPRFVGMAEPTFYIHSFMGWVVEEKSIIRKGHRSRYEIQVGGPKKWLEDFEGIFTVLEQDDTPDDWNKMDTITTDRSILYIIREYTTIGSLISIELSGVPNYSKEETIQQSNIWGQIDNLAKASKVCTAACDSLGTLYIRRKRSYMETSERNVMSTPTIALTLEDWTDAGGITFGTQKTEVMGWAKGAGSTYLAAVNTVAFAIAAGFVGGYTGNKTELPFQRLDANFDAQLQIRQLTGHHYKLESNPNRLQPLSLMGNLDVIEPAWGEPITVECTIDNIRGITIDREYVVTNVSVTHSNDPDRKPKDITWTVEEVTFGNPGLPDPQASEGGVEGEGFFPYEFDDAFVDAGADAYFTAPSGTVAPPVPPPCSGGPALLILGLSGTVMTHAGGDLWDAEQSSGVYTDPPGQYKFTHHFKEAYGRCINVSFVPTASAYEIIECDGDVVSGTGGGGGVVRENKQWFFNPTLPFSYDGTYTITCVEE